MKAAVLWMSFYGCLNLFVGHLSAIEKEGQNVWVELDRALIVAINSEQPDIVKALLDNGANPNAKSKAGETALSIAVARTRIDMIKIILRYQPDSNAKGPTLNGSNRLESYENTVLIQAAKAGHGNIVKILLENGADVNIKNKLGEMAFIWAEKNNNKEMVETLRKAGARE